MAGPADQVSVRVGVAASRLHPVPVTRPRGRLVFLLPLPVAAAAGLGAGVSPQSSTGRDGRRRLGRGPGHPGGVGGARRDRHRRLRGLPRAPLTLGDRLAGRGAPGRLGGPAGAGAAARPAAASRSRCRSSALAGAILVAFVVHPNGAAGLQVCAKYAELADRDAGAGRRPLRTAGASPGGPRLRAGLCRRVAVRHRHRRPLRPAPGGGSGGERRHPRLLPASPRFPLVGTVRTRREQPVWRVWACFAVLLAAGVGTQSRAAAGRPGRHDPGRRAHRTAGAAPRRGPAGRRHDRGGARHRRAAAAHRPGPRPTRSATPTPTSPSATTCAWRRSR